MIQFAGFPNPPEYAKMPITAFEESPKKTFSFHIVVYGHAMGTAPFYSVFFFDFFSYFFNPICIHLTHRSARSGFSLVSTEFTSQFSRTHWCTTFFTICITHKFRLDNVLFVISDDCCHPRGCSKVRGMTPNISCVITCLMSVLLPGIDIAVKYPSKIHPF